ncbi:MAG: coproporphyrinogen III oxidase [Rhodospirillales bacterium]|nr:coproporphyrinogen III oxidase [Alphaproteobacteria bacterium]MCB9987214.1 coproporphyrinogen III oxidase [Rhodospirillales bacterium]USO07924.1 MAG: coproporphyrinogen III oxidase [Rhodospirillales bacterium]
MSQDKAPILLMPDTPPPIALYVHWPFCKAKCPYCDFNSHVRAGVDDAAWAAALLRELEYTAGQLGARRVTSIFFGGGTPSLMAADTVAAVIAAAGRVWMLADDCEITLEANPTSVEAGKFRDFRAAGVNRVSIGVQSLVPADLAALGRQHSVEEARAAVDLAARIFPRYSFDLIYARPGQTPDAWENELRAALSMAGDHLSAYQLTIEPNTQFFTLYHSDRLKIPDEDQAAIFYEITQNMMDAHGMPAYEVSNHARPGCESRHNLTYWRYGEYAGIGPGAHGRVFLSSDWLATRTHRAPEVWLERVRADGHGYHPFEAIDARARFEERLMMGLRLREGVALDGLEQGGLNLGLVPELQAAGLLADVPGRLVPTQAGRLVLTSLNAALLA